MKVICNRSVLGDALALLGGVVDVRTTRPILQCLRFQAQEGSLTVVGTDLELGMRYCIKEVEVQETGQTVAPAAKLSAIIHQAEEQTVTLATEQEQLRVTTPGAEFRLHTFDPEEYPPVSPRADGNTFTISAGLLTSIAQRTIYAAARMTSRYAINGLHMAVSKNKLTMVATDGRRLAQARGTLTTSTESEIACIIPTKAVAMVERLSTDPDLAVEVTVTDSQVAFTTAHVVLISSLVEGHFPSYEAVIPKESMSRVKLAPQEFLRAVKRAALMTSKESHSVKLSITSGKMIIEAKVPEQGQATIEMPIQYDGEALEAAFNPDFLTDPLKVLPSDQIALEFKNPTTPAVMKAGPDFLYVIMPVTSA